MCNKNIKIYLGEDEYVRATPLGDELVRILDQPELAYDQIWKGDIVRIRQDRARGDMFSVFDEVVYTSYPCKTAVCYHTEGDLRRLSKVLTAVGCKFLTVFEPEDNKAGMLVVGHREKIDPGLIGLGLGIEQHMDDPEEEQGPSRETPSIVAQDRTPTAGGGAMGPKSVLHEKMEEFFSAPAHVAPEQRTYLGNDDGAGTVLTRHDRSSNGLSEILGNYVHVPD